MDHNVFFSTQGYPGKLPKILSPHSELADPQFRNLKNFDFFIQNKTLLEKHKIVQIDASKISLTQEFPKKYREYSIRNGEKQQVRISQTPNDQPKK